jgi:hypothetical protein
MVRQGGTHYTTIADALNRAAGTLQTLDAGASSGSASITQLLSDCTQVLNDCQAAEGRYRAAGQALTTYAYALDTAQTTSLQALYAARSAASDATDARKLATKYDGWATAAAKDGEPDLQTTYHNWANQQRTDAGYADQRVTAQKNLIEQACTDRDTAANTAISQIESATTSDGLNDTWWDNWGSKIVHIIADVAQWVATVAGVLALLLCWVPVLGEALMAIAAIAGVVAAVANTVLAATGEESWTQALLSIGFAILGCVGLGGAKGILSALKGGANLLKSGTRLADAFATGGKNLLGTIGQLKNITTGLKNAATDFKGSIADAFKNLTRPRIKPPETKVPPYGELGKKTSGTFIRPDGSEIPLVSGWHPPASQLPSTPGMNIVTKMHVEAHAAATMRTEGLTTGTLWINKVPCPGIRGCAYLLPRMVPTGAELTIHVVPNGSMSDILTTIIVKGIG